MNAPETDHHGMLIKGLMLMILAMMILPCMDAIAKYMSSVHQMSPGQVTFYRFLFQLLVTMPLLFATGGLRAFKTRRPFLNLLRGCLHAAATLFFFTAVKYMPLADAFAIYFVEPFLLTAMSALFLGESVGWRRWLAILVGFGGALIVIQPSFEVFGAKALLPVVCAFLFALYLFLNRAVGDLDPPLAMQTLAGLGGVVFTGAILLGGSALGVEEFVPSLPSTTFLLMLLVVLGALSGYGHLLVVRAFRLAPLSVLAPFQYFEIISATLLGFLLFGDFPSPSKWLGVAIIVGSGLFIIWRARKRETAPPVAT